MGSSKCSAVEECRYRRCNRSSCNSPAARARQAQTATNAQPRPCSPQMEAGAPAPNLQPSKNLFSTNDLGRALPVAHRRQGRSQTSARTSAHCTLRRLAAQRNQLMRQHSEVCCAR
eukprot:6363863-Pyramimonas_sp.AAC.1